MSKSEVKTKTQETPDLKDALAVHTAKLREVEDSILKTRNSLINLERHRDRLVGAVSVLTDLLNPKSVEKENSKASE